MLCGDGVEPAAARAIAAVTAPTRNHRPRPNARVVSCHGEITAWGKA